MPTRKELVDEALSWVGTRFKANQSVKGVGADCVGAQAGIARNCGIDINYSNDYSLSPSKKLLEWLRAHLVPVKDGSLLPGDILAMTFGAEDPHHVAMYVGDGEIVHAYVSVRRCVKQKYDTYWRDATKAVFRFPGVEE